MGAVIPMTTEEMKALGVRAARASMSIWQERMAVTPPEDRPDYARWLNDEEFSIKDTAAKLEFINRCAGIDVKARKTLEQLAAREQQ